MEVSWKPSIERNLNQPPQQSISKRTFAYIGTQKPPNPFRGHQSRRAATSQHAKTNPIESLLERFAVAALATCRTTQRSAARDGAAWRGCHGSVRAWRRRPRAAAERAAVWAASRDASQGPAAEGTATEGAATRYLINNQVTTIKCNKLRTSNIKSLRCMHVSLSCPEAMVETTWGFGGLLRILPL